MNRNILRKLSLFKDVEIGITLSIARQSKLQYLNKGEFLGIKGQICSNLIWIVYGKVIS